LTLTDHPNGVRLVLDTNVVISALVFQSGRLAEFRTRWQSGQLRPLVSKPTIEELIQALAYPKFNLSASEQESLLADYLPFCEVVGTEHESRKTPKIPKCRDPADEKFLILAVAGQVSMIVSGDKDLLALHGQDGLSILSPLNFLTGQKAE
jgi:uncharacterized protein